MSDTFLKVEVITDVARRRRFPTDLKLAIVAETMQPLPRQCSSECRSAMLPAAWSVAQPIRPLKKYLASGIVM